MSKWAGKRVNVQYNRINEPNFLKKFKKQVGYKEDHGLSEKFAEMPKATTEDTKDRDDEKPQIVQLNDGDISKDEFEQLAAPSKEQVSKGRRSSRVSKGLRSSQVSKVRRSSKVSKEESKSETKTNEHHSMPMINPADIPLPGTFSSNFTAPLSDIPIPGSASDTPVSVSTNENIHEGYTDASKIPGSASDTPISVSTNESIHEGYTDASKIPEYDSNNSQTKDVSNNPLSESSSETADPKVKDKLTPPWWTDEIEKILQDKKRASRKYQRTGDFCDLYDLKELRVVARRTIRNARYKLFKETNPDSEPIYERKNKMETEPNPEK